MLRKEVAGYKIDLSNYIGRGAFAIVYQCYKEGIYMPLCVKIINLSSSEDYDQQAVKREIRILFNLMKFNHPNIIKVIQIYEDWEQKICYIFMEKCNQGHIENTIKARASVKQFFTSTEIIEMTTQIIQGYSILYKNSIIHRDLKPENLLFGNDGKIKISDFGMSKILEKEARNQLYFINLNIVIQSQVGTPYYASPQVLSDGIIKIEYCIYKYSSKTDIFSLGVIVYYFTFLQLPFDKRTIYDLKQHQEFLLKGKDMIFPEMKIQGEKHEKDLLLLFLSKTLTFYEENRIDWPSVFKMFLPPEECIDSTTIAQQQDIESIIEPISSLFNDNTGLKRTYESYQSYSQCDIRFSFNFVSNNEISRINSIYRYKQYQVRTLISNLMAREELAKSVQQYLICLNKYNAIFSNQDKSMLKAALCGYQMAINLNQIYLISNQYDLVCKQIQETFKKNSIKIDCEIYMKDKYEKVEQQKETVKKNAQINLIQFKESIQQVLQVEIEIKDEALKKFITLLSKAEQQPNYEIYAHWFNYYYQKYIISKMQKYLSQAQEQETLMFLALSKKFTSVEIDHPLKDFFTIDPSLIQYINSELIYLKQYVRSNQQQQIIDQNRNEK